MKKIWSSIAKDLWVAILDIIAVNAAYFLALLVRFYVRKSTMLWGINMKIGFAITSSRR